MIENQDNQTLITDSDVTEMARSMGLEVIESPSTDEDNVTSLPVYSINVAGAPVNSLEEDVVYSENNISQTRESVESNLNGYIERLMQESPAITELTSEHIIDTVLHREDDEVPFENTDTEIEESAAVESSMPDPNSTTTPTGGLLETTVNPNIIPPISESVNTAESTIRFS